MSGGLARWWLVRWMRLRAALDRRRVRALCRRHPGLEIHPDAASAFAVATFNLEEGARVVIGPGVVTERRPDALRITVQAGGVLEIGARTWLRTELAPVIFHVYEGARLEIGEQAFLNGCQISSKVGVRLGLRAWVGPGSRVFDSDQHPMDPDNPERMEPVVIGDHCWVAADVTVLRGVEIGAHTIVGARSLVTRSLPPHSLAYGSPAKPHGHVGDRSQVNL